MPTPEMHDPPKSFITACDRMFDLIQTTKAVTPALKSLWKKYAKTYPEIWTPLVLVSKLTDVTLATHSQSECVMLDESLYVANE
jgi:hypothetical protein